MGNIMYERRKALIEARVKREVESRVSEIIEEKLDDALKHIAELEEACSKLEVELKEKTKALVDRDALIAKLQAQAASDVKGKKPPAAKAKPGKE